MRSVIATGALFFFTAGAGAQCTNYLFTITSGGFPLEVDWEFIDSFGNVWVSGGAPSSQTICLPVECYSMYMYDSFGDGWNGATWTIQQLPAMTTVGSGTLTAGSFGTVQVSLGGGCGGGPCDWYTLNVSAGSFPTEISWNFIQQGSGIVSIGYAPASVGLCLDTGCYYMDMYDTFGDGWNGATWSLYDPFGALVQSGTMPTGSNAQQYVAVGIPAASCAPPPAVTASDCSQAVNICTDYSWAVDPNGIGALNEIPPLGSAGNPDFLAGDFVNSPWGTDNYGCLRNNELNSTWMIINISGSGSLEFTFGGFGTQAGFYDWIMYPYNSNTCAGIMANTVAPVRCNWNGTTTGGTGLASVIPPGGSVLNYEPPLNVLAGQQYLICFSNWSSVTTVVPLEFGGTATVSCDPVILPVELMSFTAQAVQDGVRLLWSTATENGLSRFDMEHSTDLWSWQTVGSMTAAGCSQQQHSYSWVDASPASGTNYYRLRLIDNDGSSEISAIVSAHWLAIGALVHPNPSPGTFWVENAGEAISVIDATGRTVPFVLRSATNLARCLQVNEPGLYSVRIGEGDAMRTARLLVE